MDLRLFCVYQEVKQMEQNNPSYLATEKISKLMGKYAVPCIISLLVGALYNIVDQIFIANAPILAPTATPPTRSFFR